MRYLFAVCFMFVCVCVLKIVSCKYSGGNNVYTCWRHSDAKPSPKAPLAPFRLISIDFI